MRSASAVISFNDLRPLLDFGFSVGVAGADRCTGRVDVGAAVAVRRGAGSGFGGGTGSGTGSCAGAGDGSGIGSGRTAIIAAGMGSVAGGVAGSISIWGNMGSCTCSCGGACVTGAGMATG